MVSALKNGKNLIHRGSPVRVMNSHNFGHKYENYQNVTKLLPNDSLCTMSKHRKFQHDSFAQFRATSSQSFDFGAYITKLQTAVAQNRGKLSS